jgi:predicted transposase YbfD/YdcC
VRSGGNCARHETRAIETTPVSATSVSFPFAAQAGRLSTRVEHAGGEVTETSILLLTSREQARMSAGQMLALRREYWGIETGLHSRLDVSALEDKSRVRLRNNAMVLAVMRRLSVSLGCDWIKRQTNRRRANLPGFFEAMRNGTALDLLTRPPLTARSILGLVE